MTSSTIRQEFLERFQRQLDLFQAPMVDAAHGLETKLARLALASSPTAWRSEAASEVEALKEKVEAHVAQAESYGGLIQEMEVLQGHPRELTLLHDSHQEELAAAAALLVNLEVEAADRSPATLLRELGRLIAAVRAHQAREVDVIYEIFWRDPVGGD
jgi:hypothetical protein